MKLGKRSAKRWRKVRKPTPEPVTKTGNAWQNGSCWAPRSLTYSPKPMATLPTEFDSKGFHFKQLQRSEKYALYERAKPDGSQNHFEVIVIQWRKAVTWPDGRVTKTHEGFPIPEDWGTLAWSFSAASHRDPYGSALKCYLNLCQDTQQTR